MNDFQLSENFNLKEFECTHPEHRHVQLDEKLLEKLQKLRSKIGRPLIINSAYRCPERNAQVGGAKKSQHLFGRAVDVSIHNLNLSQNQILEMAKNLDFTGIGLYNNFVHLDVRNSPEIVVWDGR